MKSHQKEDLHRFRKYAEDRLQRFQRDEHRLSMQFQPLDKVYRTIVCVYFIVNYFLETE